MGVGVCSCTLSMTRVKPTPPASSRHRHINPSRRDPWLQYHESPPICHEPQDWTQDAPQTHRSCTGSYILNTGKDLRLSPFTEWLTVTAVTSRSSSGLCQGFSIYLAAPSCTPTDYGRAAAFARFWSTSCFSSPWLLATAVLLPHRPPPTYVCALASPSRCLLSQSSISAHMCSTDSRA